MSVMLIMLNDESWTVKHRKSMLSHNKTIFSQPEPWSFANAEQCPVLRQEPSAVPLLKACFLPSSPLLYSDLLISLGNRNMPLFMRWTNAFPILSRNLNRTIARLYLKLWQESRLQFFLVTKVVFSDLSPPFCLSQQVFDLFLWNWLKCVVCRNQWKQGEI